ncbi:hypothetical protein [Subtercola boreus]|nr:hypothetical protein [Subtercola boreus]
MAIGAPRAAFPPLASDGIRRHPTASDGIRQDDFAQREMLITTRD